MPSGQITSQPPPDEKDLSFLLDRSTYHPLSQLEIPVPFRQQFTSPPTIDTPLQDSLSQLEELLGKGNFLSGAFLAAAILVSGSVGPTDSKTIFELLAVRYSCLELTGNGLLAAQEAKALEDLNSAFYYIDPPLPADMPPGNDQEQPLQQHIMPFALRLQALRLQAIGFSDTRRGISALYDLGLECREHIASSFVSREDRELWANRLDEIGVKAVNSLVEMGDLDCAVRTLATLKPSSPENSGAWRMRMILLHLKIGDLTAIQRIMKEPIEGCVQMEWLQPLLTFAEGRYEEAAMGWEKYLENDSLPEEAALIKQNLAVAYLYAGNIDKTGDIMESLLEEGNSFPGLVINLATLYELTSDRSRDLKLDLASRIAKQNVKPNQTWTKTNADFKL